jgi:hypothetical protein
MAVELKEVIEKATTKKEVIIKGAKGTGKKNEWWDKKYKQLKKEAVKALREWKRTKINRNSFVEAKGRERTEKESLPIFTLKRFTVSNKFETILISKSI